MPRPKVGLSLLPADDLRDAQLPLFESGLVEALEWTIDAEFAHDLPPWLAPLLDHYAAANALYAHGVDYSPLSAVFQPRQARWLEQARLALSRRRYQHLSEHFGFSTVPGLARGAPLPMPFVPSAVHVGRERLRRLRDCAELPIGLENLALAMCRDDVRAHGEFLEQLLAPIDGLLLLDLHNLYCQAVNFDVPADVLALSMPLERVRELHVSGGSWSSVETTDGPRPFRRDTHDGDVPEGVFALLAFVLPRCPKLEVVFVERLGDTLNALADADRYRRDYRRVQQLVHNAHGAAGE
ncbi:MAG: DUF692 family protein [Polyangiaceae bacterium]